jgi:molybdopterin converting factor small subunit
MNPEIRWISLKNNGAFVARIRIKGAFGSYNVGGDICKGNEKTFDLADAVGTIKDGDEVWLEAVVKGGYNKTSKQHFTYRKSSNMKGRHTIKGTTLKNSMSCNGLVECFTRITEPISCISLKNSGGFVARIRVKGAFGSYNVNQDICVGQEKTVNLADAVGTIKDGDEVWLEAVVKGGYNNTGGQHFVYRKTSNKKACYTIKGTTLNNSMPYNGLVEYFTRIAEPIRGISLKNNGAFVTTIRVKGGSSSFNVGLDICVGQEQTIDLAQAVGTIKDGDEVWLEAVVTGGYNNMGKQHFIYRKSSVKRASYTIKGTTLNNSMSYYGLESYYVHVGDPIRFISLKNTGGFVTQIRVRSCSGSRTVTQDICVAQERRYDLANAVSTLKDGDEVWLEAVVKGGANKTGRQRFIYRRSSDNKALYTISGTTQINSLSYNGLFKVGVAPWASVSYSDTINKIDKWDKKQTACAWPGILKREIVDGLKEIARRYFIVTNKYTTFRNCNNSSTDYQSGIDQGSGFPICGPVAVMFYLAKLNISTFVDTVTALYETGSLMGYSVPYSLRKIEKDGNKIEKKYECSDDNIANVCWMFEASLAQKESILDIELEASSVKMHTRHDEMEDDVNYVFNASSVKHQGLATWSTVDKAMSNLDEWTNYLKDYGTVFWLMHSTELKNIRDKNHKSYNHVDVPDLHWVVVLDVRRNGSDVTICLHSWGNLYSITVSRSTFQKMSYLAVLFKVRP